MNTQTRTVWVAKIFFTVCICAPPLPAESGGSDAESQLRATVEELRKAGVEGDTDKVVASMTDDYLQTDIFGFVQDKATWLKQYFIPLAELIKAGKFRWEKYDLKDVQLRMHGDAAIVIGTLEAKGVGARMDMATHSWAADPTASFSGVLHFTRVYVRQNGKWMLAALQNSMPPAPASTKP